MIAYALVLYWLMTLTIPVATVVSDIEVKESTLSIVLISIGITVLGAFGVNYRVSSINRMLSQGISIPGKVTRFLEVQFFTQAWLVYQWQSAEVHVKLWLPSGNSTRILKAQEDVVLFVQPAAPRKAVIGTLYINKAKG